MNEDLLNVMGNFVETELDYIENCEKEKFELQQERNNYKELYEKEKKNWNKLKEWFKEEIKYDENWYNPECEEYIGPKKYPDDTIDCFKYSLNKMQEIERL